MLDNLNSEQIEGILETLPVDISFVDKNDTVKFWNHHDARDLKRPLSAIGKSVQQCHHPDSVENVDKVISVLKSSRKDLEEFWIDEKERKLYYRYFAVRDKDGKYLGTLEVGQDITDINKI